MTTDTPTEGELSDRELVVQFESLGDNCELGLVQRMAGVDPLGLFRFASAPVRNLTRALASRFEGMADPSQIGIEATNGEYMIKLAKHGFLYHAQVKIGEADPVLLQRQQGRTIPFLIDKLVADLENPKKVMVFRQNEELSANDLIDLRSAIADVGSATLLWVQQTRTGFPADSVVVVDDTLMIGYVTRLASRENVPDLDLRSWVSMLRKAYAAWPIRSKKSPDNPAATTSRRTDIRFGRDGNSIAATGKGWSGRENGYTWAIDGRSELTIANPGPAENYLLEMHVIPFVAPPAVMAQTMGITLNGQLIHTFDPLPRGKVSCPVPGQLLKGRDMIEIVLEHPTAASPRAVLGAKDDRRLAASFSSLSLICN
jgi:hypothetical protein